MYNWGQLHNFTIKLLCVIVATRRDPPTEDNAGVWIIKILFAYAQCAQKCAYGTTKTRNKKQYKKPDITHISNRNNPICTNMHMLNRYQSDIDTNTCISAFKTEPRQISFRISIGYHTKQVTGHLSNHGWPSKTNVISLLIKLYQYTIEYTRTTISSHYKVSQIITLNTVTIGPIT